MGLIYKITNLKNGMVYIGRSSKTLEEAWTAHRYESGQRNPARLIGQAIKEFGIENFTKEIIEECDAAELRKRHKYWMEVYKSQDEGYNKRHKGGTIVFDDDIIEMHNNGMSAAEIAHECGCDERTVVSHIKSIDSSKTIKDITYRTGRPHSKEAILNLWNEGLNHLEIAQQLQKTKTWVRSILCKSGITIEEIYTRCGLPAHPSYHKYEYAQTDAHDALLDSPNHAKSIARKHKISTTALYNACTGPSKKVHNKTFRRINENGEIVPRMCEPVGNVVPVRATYASNPALTQEFPSITAAAVALVGEKNILVMQKIREAAENAHEYQGMYWSAESTENKRRPIYAFSIENYKIQHVFLTQTEAAAVLHVHPNIISRHLNYPQKYHSAGGFICTWNEHFTEKEWSEAVKQTRPANGRCKHSQIKEQNIYLTNINKYEVIHCFTLLDAIEKTQSSVVLIQKCLNGQALHTKNYFVTNYPISVAEWEERIQNLNPNCKPVYGVHPITGDIVVANSIKEAAEKVNCHRSLISKALRGIMHVAAGYQWYYGIPQTA